MTAASHALRRGVIELAAAGVEGEAVSRACLAAGPGAGPADVVAALRARAAAAAPDAVAAAERRLARLGAEVLVAGCEGYPPRLTASWPDLGAPLWLFARGTVPDRPAVAIVGTRRPTLHGLEVARRLAGRCAEGGAVVVSGLARGIDQAAHEGALAAAGATVAVLGAGLGVDYPAGSRRLREAVAEAGGLLTEHLPGTPPRPHRFLHRNRIIAGLADVVVLVEGGPRSGALTTARLGLEQGREVLACPAALDSPASEAPLALLRDGAGVVTDPDDVLAALGLAPADGGSAHEGAGADAESADGLGAEAAAVHALLSTAPAGIDALVEASGLSARAVVVAVAELVGRGLARRGPGGVVAAAHP